jgi:hypothetical protein
MKFEAISKRQSKSIERPRIETGHLPSLGTKLRKKRDLALLQFGKNASGGSFGRSLRPINLSKTKADTSLIDTFETPGIGQYNVV